MNVVLLLLFSERMCCALTVDVCTKFVRFRCAAESEALKGTHRGPSYHCGGEFYHLSALQLFREQDGACQYGREQTLCVVSVVGIQPEGCFRQHPALLFHGVFSQRVSFSILADEKTANDTAWPHTQEISLCIQASSV